MSAFERSCSERLRLESEAEFARWKRTELDRLVQAERDKAEARLSEQLAEAAREARERESTLRQSLEAERQALLSERAAWEADQYA